MDPEYKAAKSAALDRTSRRETSTGDLLIYLKKKGYSPEVSRAVCDEMVALRFVDDERYARLWIRAQAQRGKGALLVSRKLREKGIQMTLRQVQDIVQETVEGSEAIVARRLVERKYPRASEDPKIARRAAQMLIRNGYSFET